MTDDLLAQIEKAAAAVERAEGQLALVSATVEFVAAADIELVIGDQRVTLPAGETWSTLANATTEVEVPGIVTARVTPGMSALEIQTQYTAAQQDLAAGLAAAQVADLAAARSTDQRRRELQSARDQLTATLAGLCGDDDVEQLRSRLAELRSLPAFSGDITIDAGTARTELDEAEAGRVTAGADCETHRRVAALAMSKLTEVSTQATRLQDKLVTQRAELAVVVDRLTQQRATVADDKLTATADADARRRRPPPAGSPSSPSSWPPRRPKRSPRSYRAVEAAAVLRERHEEIARTLHEIAVAAHGIRHRRPQGQAGRRRDPV